MKRQTQQGAALLLAMLTVTLVATFASAALWQQWRGVEIESAERSRSQMQWILNGALDWARLILQEDARNGEIDHLSEPWALPLQEARLSSFLAADKNHTDDALDAFLSGQITDQQALLNVRNLVQEGKPKPAAVKAFTRLFNQLGLPSSQVQTLVDQLIASDAASNADTKPDTQSPGLVKALAPLKPYRMEQLVWLGLPTRSVHVLMPYATLLPVPTPINLNTANAEVLHAALPSVDMGQAHQMVVSRANGHFKSVAEGLKAAGLGAGALGSIDNNDFSVGTHFFAVRGRLRLGDSTVQEVSLVERNATAVKVVWRQREVQTAAAMASLQ